MRGNLKPMDLESSNKEFQGLNHNYNN